MIGAFSGDESTCGGDITSTFIDCLRTKECFCLSLFRCSFAKISFFEEHPCLLGEIGVARHPRDTFSGFSMSLFKKTRY